MNSAMPPTGPRRCEQRPNVVRALDAEEEAYASLAVSGSLPDWEPPLQVGRVPVR